MKGFVANQHQRTLYYLTGTTSNSEEDESGVLTFLLLRVRKCKRVALQITFVLLAGCQSALLFGCLSRGNLPKEMIFSEAFSQQSETALETNDSSFIVRAGEDIIFLNDKIIVGDELGRKILVFTRKGEFARKIGAYGRGPGEYLAPKRICITRSGQLYVWDYLRNFVLVYDSSYAYRCGLQLSKWRIDQWGPFGDSVVAVGSAWTSNIQSVQVGYINQCNPVDGVEIVHHLDFPRLFEMTGARYLVPATDEGNFYLLEESSFKIMEFSSNGQLVRSSAQVPAHFVKPEHDLETQDPSEVLKVLQDHTPTIAFTKVGSSFLIIWVDRNLSKPKYFCEIFDSNLKLRTTHVEMPDGFYPYLYSDGTSLFLLTKNALNKKGNIQNPAIVQFSINSSVFDR